MKRLSPAKINLHLSVLGKRPDGYHNIITLMQRIDLFDEMEFEPLKEGISVRCAHHPELEDEDNLSVRAAKIFFQATQREGGVAINLIKRIPIAAGLGGGSSNAATTLIALNELMGYPLARDELAAMGKRLGADVPFFVYEKNAWATGIGEELIPVYELPTLPLLLVNPGFPLPTRLVYENLNLRLTKNKARYNIRRISEVREIVEILHNDLEDVAIGLHPVIGIIKDRLRAAGAVGTLMSGSGPTVFGIFKSLSHAERAKEDLKSQTNWKVMVACTI
jgi:4-diphosphocytidyl-2-C-methyl-D-erythritol kinase